MSFVVLCAAMGGLWSSGFAELSRFKQNAQPEGHRLIRHRPVRITASASRAALSTHRGPEDEGGVPAAAAARMPVGQDAGPGHAGLSYPGSQS